MIDAFFNLAFLAATAITPALVLYADSDVLHPRLGQVAAVSFHEGQGWWAKECRFTGLMVAYDRDWEDVTSGESIAQESVTPPAPNQIHGYAYVINKKSCPGKEPEHMAYIAERLDSSIIWNREQMNKGFRIDARDPREITNAEKQVKWLPQVVKRIESAAGIDPVAKAFMEFNTKAKLSQEAKAQ